MSNSTDASLPKLTILPGTGVTFDAVTGDIALSPEALASGAELVVAAGPSAAWRVQLSAVAADPVKRLVLDSAAALAEVGFLGTAAAAWTLVNGAARLVPATTARTHGAWITGDSDGLYRCLFRIAGGQPAAVDRRFTFGARIGFAGGDWNGIRVEPFETSAGKRYLHIREYTGTSGSTTSLATAAIAWAYDTWQWLEVKVSGTTVAGRLYAEGAEAPEWQVAATTNAVEPGAFGPGAFPAAGLAPVIDIRRLEYVPAT